MGGNGKKLKEKSTFRIYCEYYPFLLLYGVLRLLPLKCGYTLVAPLISLLFLVDRRHARRSVQHILHAGITDDRAEARRLARRSYREFGKLLVEIVKMDQLYTPDHVVITGPEETLNLILPERNSGKRQVIIATAHYGNWEVAGTAFATRTATPMFSLMRAFGNPLIGELILAHRRSDVHILIDKRLGIRPVLKALNDGRTATMLIDQHAAGNEGVDCLFFGHPARVHMTPALLHLKTGIPILPEITVRVGDDFRFELRCGKLIRYQPTGDKTKDVQVVSQMCISALEEMIRKDPDQWLWAPRHWLDINRRQAEEYHNWKPAPEIASIAAGYNVTGNNDEEKREQ